MELQKTFATGKGLFSFLSSLVIAGFLAFSVVRAATPADYGLREGDLIRATGDADIFIVNEHGYKRLFLNPVIFKMYGHLGGWGNVKTVSPETRDAFETSALFRNCETRNPAVFALEVTGEDSGILHWVNVSGERATQEDPDFFKKVFCINLNEHSWYSLGEEYVSLNQIPIYSEGRTPLSVSKEISIPPSIETGPKYIPSQITLDITPPAGITDLKVFNVTDVEVTLTWTAPGDDGNSGTAARYEFPYSRTPFYETTWSIYGGANVIPQSAGTAEFYSFSRLDPNTTYYFTIKTYDEINNASAISNLAVVTTDREVLIREISISAHTLNKFSVQIVWETSRPATSQIEYGITIPYELRTERDPNVTKGHSLIIEDLKADTVYNFRVISQGADGIEQKSSNFTFVMPPLGNSRLSELLAWAQVNDITFQGVKHDLDYFIGKNSFDPLTESFPFEELPDTDMFLEVVEKLPAHLVDTLQGDNMYFSIKPSRSSVGTYLSIFDPTLDPKPSIMFLFWRAGGKSLASHELGHLIDFHGIRMDKGRGFTLGKTDEEIRRIYVEFLRVFDVPEDVLGSSGTPSGFLIPYATVSFAENFAVHFAYYMIFPDAFRQKATSDPGIEEKYEFLKSEIFRGIEY